jgi:hypothetical protein
VPCDHSHTAITFSVGELDSVVDGHLLSVDSDHFQTQVADACPKAFAGFVGGTDEARRQTMLRPVWFTPSLSQSDQGADWYRCDVVGGSEQSKRLVDLPPDVEGLLAQTEDKWLVCAEGPTVDGSVKVPCSTAHDWRAVSTIKLGEPDDAYPGDAAAEKTTRDYCSKSVAAWLGYPVDYDYGYTWFHEAEWNAGNRRSVCWAKTSQ